MLLAFGFVAQFPMLSSASFRARQKKEKKGNRRGVNKKTPCMRVTDVEYLLQGVHIVAEVGGGEHRNRSRGRKGGRNCTIFFGA